MDTEKNTQKEHYYIICIDDDDTFLDSLSLAIPNRLSEQYPEFNYQFEFVNNTNDLFQLVNDLKNDKENIALVISDQKMPDMSGIELLEKVSKNLPDTMRMLLTGYAGLESAKYAINRHLLDQYIAKPIDDYNNFISIISHLIEKFHLKLLKIKQEKEIREHIKSINKANQKIEKMLKTAEEMAYFAKDIKMLDLDEVLNLAMEKIPKIFNVSEVSIFLAYKDKDIYKLRLVRATHIKHDIELIMDENGNMPVKEIVRHSSGKIIEERMLDREQYTPIQKAIEDDSVLIIPDIQASDLKLLKRNGPATSCVIVPFITKSIYDNQDRCFDKETAMIMNIGGILNIGGLKTDAEEIDYLKYKASLIREILGATISNAQIFYTTKKMAITDSLTGLYNNRLLNELLKAEIERATRYKKIFSVMVCDIDNFKRINDEFGHLEGDKVLRKLASILNRVKRRSDMLFRYGGEEFVCILPETTSQQAYLMIERMRKEIEETTFDNKSIHITLSFGITQCPNHEKDEIMEDILRRADMAMYKAKSEGKNKVEISAS